MIPMIDDISHELCGIEHNNPTYPERHMPASDTWYHTKEGMEPMHSKCKKGDEESCF